MKRRVLLASTASAALSPATLRAQQKAMRVVGGLVGGSPGPHEKPYYNAFGQGLAQQGFTVGQNVANDVRYAEGRYDRLPALAAELVGRGVDVIVVYGIPEARAAKAATSTIPIIYAGGGDLVANGLVASLARPGGNLTGIAFLNVELSSKRFELLSELVPSAQTIALLVNPENPITARMTQDVLEAARRKGVLVKVVEATDENGVDVAFKLLVDARAGALMVGTDPFLASRRAQLVALAERHSVPAMFGFATDGAHVSYGTSLVATYRQVGRCAGRVLNGEKPMDMPVEQATTFELIVNMKTAKALGLTIPASILARADEVIE